MTLAMMNTHKAFKALQLAGISDQQAEALVEIFSEMQQDNALSRADLMKAGEGISGSINVLDGRIHGVEIRMMKAESRLDGIEVRLIKIESRLDAIEIHLGKNDVRMDAIEVRLDALELRLDGIEAKIIVIEKDLEVLKTDMRWIKRLLMVMTTTMVIAAIKYIFS